MKKLSMIALLAAMLSSCGPGKWVGGNTDLVNMRKARKNVTVTPGVPIAYKDLERSHMVLSERPGEYDSIIITVLKQTIKRTNN